MKTRAREALIYAGLGVAIAVAGLWVLSHVLRTREPSVELARATREALRMAREARRVKWQSLPDLASSIPETRHGE